MLYSSPSQPKMRFRPGPAGPRASNGQSYVTLAQYGIKAEGDSFASTESTETAAWAKFHETLRNYLAAEGAKTIEWRKEPQIEWNDEGTRCVVRSRLCVVEKFDG